MEDSRRDEIQRKSNERKRKREFDSRAKECAWAKAARVCQRNLSDAARAHQRYVAAKAKSAAAAEAAAPPPAMGAAAADDDEDERIHRG